MGANAVGYGITLRVVFQKLHDYTSYGHGGWVSVFICTIFCHNKCPGHIANYSDWQNPDSSQGAEHIVFKILAFSVENFKQV